MDELNQLLAMLGAPNFSAGTTAIANLNTFIDAAKAMTGKPTTADALASIKSMAANSNAVEKALSKTGDAALNEISNLQAFAKAVESATGAQGAEALGVIAAGKNASARVTALEGEAQAQRKASEDRDAKDAIAEAVTDGRLRPAAKEQADTFYNEHGLKGLKSFLAALPPGAPVTSTSTNPALKQPAPKTEGDAPAVDAEVTKRLVAKGYSPELIAQAQALPVTIVRDLGFGKED